MLCIEFSDLFLHYIYKPSEKALSTAVPFCYFRQLMICHILLNILYNISVQKSIDYEKYVVCLAGGREKDSADLFAFSAETYHCLCSDL